MAWLTTLSTTSSPGAEASVTLAAPPPPWANAVGRYGVVGSTPKKVVAPADMAAAPARLTTTSAVPAAGAFSPHSSTLTLPVASVMSPICVRHVPRPPPPHQTKKKTKKTPPPPAPNGGGPRVGLDVAILVAAELLVSAVT